jgi:hypothetical protein
MMRRMSSFFSICTGNKRKLLRDTGRLGMSNKCRFLSVDEFSRGRGTALRDGLRTSQVSFARVTFYKTHSCARALIHMLS